MSIVCCIHWPINCQSVLCRNVWKFGSSARKLILFCTMTVDSLLYNLRYIWNLDWHQHLWSIDECSVLILCCMTKCIYFIDGIHLINGWKEVLPFKLIKAVAIACRLTLMIFQDNWFNVCMCLVSKSAATKCCQQMNQNFDSNGKW